MTRPSCTGNCAPRLSAQVVESVRQSGSALAIVQCVITVQGTLEECRVIKGIPGLEDITQQMASWRYSPVTFQGTPARVRYTFNIKIVPP